MLSADEYETLLRTADDEFLDDAVRLDALVALVNGLDAPDPHPEFAALLAVLTGDEAVSPRVAGAAGVILVHYYAERGQFAEELLDALSPVARAAATREVLTADPAQRPSERQLRERRYLAAARDVGGDDHERMAALVAADADAEFAELAQWAAAQCVRTASARVGSAAWAEQLRGPAIRKLTADHGAAAAVLDLVEQAGVGAEALEPLLRLAAREAVAATLYALDGLEAHPDLPGWDLVEWTPTSEGRRQPTGRLLGSLAGSV